MTTYLKSYPHFSRTHEVFAGFCNLDCSSQSYEAAVLYVLDGLDELPTCALVAMHRKVRGIRGYIPQVMPPKHGWKQDKLIKLLRKTCIEMLSTTGDGNELQELLNKAMGVAVLASKLILGNQYVADLRKFSPYLEVLHMEIAKAIWFLNSRVRFTELNKLRLLLDPGSKLSKRSSRSAIRILLTESLFECIDMDSIPGGLLEALAVINQKSRTAPLKYFSKEDIEKEVECILSVGAHIKQIVWDLSHKHEFDYDFADSYMEDLEESDDDEPHNAQEFCSPPTAPNRIYKAELDSIQFIVDSSCVFSSSSLKTKKTETRACDSPLSFNGHSVMKEEPIRYSESNISCRDTSDKKTIDKKPYLAI